MHPNLSRTLSVTGALLLSATLIVSLVQAQSAHARGQGVEQPAASAAKRGDYRQRNDRLELDEALIRSIFREHRAYLQPADRLPPGIQRNLARGKPLPPGIAKRFDQQVYRQLPRYDGYEWQQVGRDAVLVAVTTGVIEAVINNIFD